MAFAQGWGVHCATKGGVYLLANPLFAQGEDLICNSLGTRKFIRIVVGNPFVEAIAASRADFFADVQILPNKDFGTKSCQTRILVQTSRADVHEKNSVFVSLIFLSLLFGSSFLFFFLCHEIFAYRACFPTFPGNFGSGGDIYIYVVRLLSGPRFGVFNSY